jgi:hypothetical protein
MVECGRTQNGVGGWMREFGETSLVGSFMKYELVVTKKVEETVVDDDLTEKVEEKIVEHTMHTYYYSCFQRHRDPALTLHVPCSWRNLITASGPKVELCMQVDGDGLLCTNTDFALTRFFFSDQWAQNG